MRMLLILLILLAFPVLEVLLLIELAARYGWWVLAYLALSAGLGAFLILGERLVVLGRLMQSLQEGGHPLLALLASARRMIAGVLFILPGVLSDIAAMLVLFARLPVPRKRAVGHQVIEGQWRREE